MVATVFPWGICSPRRKKVGLKFTSWACENPFRLSIDRKSGWLYWGDVGPDARQADPQRGPVGLDEWNRTQAAGNFGWPYCIGDNQPYVDYDFAH